MLFFVTASYTLYIYVATYYCIYILYIYINNSFVSFRLSLYSYDLLDLCVMCNVLFLIDILES